RIGATRYDRPGTAASASAGEMNGATAGLSPVGNGMPPCQFVERQMRFLIAQREADDDVFPADLAPKPFRRPFLRRRPAQAFDPNKIPFGHGHLLAPGPDPMRRAHAE